LGRHAEVELELQEGIALAYDGLSDRSTGPEYRLDYP